MTQAVRPEPADIGLWMSLAARCRAMQELPAPLTAVDRSLAIDPRTFVVLLMKASLMERAGLAREAGAAYGVAIGPASPPEALNPPTRQALAHAHVVFEQHNLAMAEALGAGVADAIAAAPGPERRRGAAFLERLAGGRRAYPQQPVQFHHPGLPDIEYYDREEFPWLEAFAPATGAIQAELAAVLRDQADASVPYVAYSDNFPLDLWADLNRSPRWSAFNLLENCAPVAAHRALCPDTLAALALLPQPRIPQRSPSAMFSVLAPRTRIPPHHGVSNARLVVHLPLVAPDGCGFRVGAETGPWRTGEAWVFDDTIEHEAWNDSDQVRTILICDVWNPRLTQEDRAIITAATAAMDAFNGAAPAGGTGL